VIIRRDGREEEIPSKIVTRLQKGDRVVLETAGGGGYGPAAERDPSALRADIADGKVGAAAPGYGMGGTE
jgi:N-methylhydantoinase B/oxoprolinase/acetone carboxylase alpha subunit